MENVSEYRERIAELQSKLQLAQYDRWRSVNEARDLLSAALEEDNKIAQLKELWAEVIRQGDVLEDSPHVIAVHDAIEKLGRQWDGA